MHIAEGSRSVGAREILGSDEETGRGDGSREKGAKGGTLGCEGETLRSGKGEGV